MFTRAVRRASWQSKQTCKLGVVNNYARFLRQHLLNFISHAQKQSPDVDLHEFVKLLDRLFMQGFQESLIAYIVESTIESFVGYNGLLH